MAFMHLLVRSSRNNPTGNVNRYGVGVMHEFYSMIPFYMRVYPLLLFIFSVTMFQYANRVINILNIHKRMRRIILFSFFSICFVVRNLPSHPSPPSRNQRIMMIIIQRRAEFFGEFTSLAVIIRGRPISLSVSCTVELVMVHVVEIYTTSSCVTSWTRRKVKAPKHHLQLSKYSPSTSRNTVLCGLCFEHLALAQHTHNMRRLCFVVEKTEV